MRLLRLRLEQSATDGLLIDLRSVTGRADVVRGELVQLLWIALYIYNSGN